MIHLEGGGGGGGEGRGGGPPYVAAVATVGQNNEPDDIWLPSTGSHNNRLAVSHS